MASEISGKPPGSQGAWENGPPFCLQPYTGRGAIVFKSHGSIWSHLPLFLDETCPSELEELAQHPQLAEEMGPGKEAGAASSLVFLFCYRDAG